MNDKTEQVKQNTKRTVLIIINSVGVLALRRPIDCYIFRDLIYYVYICFTYVRCMFNTAAIGIQNQFYFIVLSDNFPFISFALVR